MSRRLGRRIDERAQIELQLARRWRQRLARLARRSPLGPVTNHLATAAAVEVHAPVGGLQAVNAGPDTWFSMFLTAGADDAVNTPIDGSPAVTGKLTWVDYTGAAATTLDATVHAGSFGFPRGGTGARYGLSVSTNIRSAGASAAAARMSSAVLNDTMPLNER